MENVLILPQLSVRKFSLVNLFRIFRLLGILLIISFLILYIYQVNAETSERYLIKGYQQRIKELSKENQVLEINSAQIGSLDNISDLLKELSFEETEKIHYIQILETEVVAK